MRSFTGSITKQNISGDKIKGRLDQTTARIPGLTRTGKIVATLAGAARCSLAGPMRLLDTLAYARSGLCSPAASLSASVCPVSVLVLVSIPYSTACAA